MLTSCGLSILTNFLQSEKGIPPKDVYKYANAKKKDIDSGFLKTVDNAIDILQERIIELNAHELKRLSAELNTLVTFYDNRFDAQDFHLLLHTDTYLGTVTAEILEYFLKSRGLQVGKFLAKDLNTDSTEAFEWSLGEIIKDLSQTIEGYRARGYEIIFNLTGGFKGSNSFLQTMASLYADKSIYIFETGKELLVIPRLPIKIDEEFFEKNLDIFRALELGIEVDEDVLQDLPKSVIAQIGDEYILSPWGEIAWQKYKSMLYQERLIEPLSQAIEYSETFKKDFTSLNPIEKLQLNNSIDNLEKYILDKTNLRSLRYHPLKGEISRRYSHEFYPFDGNDSRRVYCNEVDGHIILEKIDAHLK